MTIFILFLSLSFIFTYCLAFAGEKGNLCRCEGFSLQSAADILNVPVDDLQLNSTEIPVSPEDLQDKTFKTNPSSCTFRSKSDFFKLITYITYVFNDLQKARMEFAKMKKGYESISRAERIEDMGDEAFWVGDERFLRLVAIKGPVVVDVLSPKDFDLQKQVVHVVFKSF